MKPKLIKLLLIILFIFNIAHSEENENFIPSVYLGFGMGTNIGGLIGAGSELKLNKYFSTNLAIGTAGKIGSEIVYGFDIGIKAYPINFIFLGLNYGLVDAESSNGVYSEIYALSITAGLRTINFENIYYSIYTGTTTDPKANKGYCGSLENSCFGPRFGIMVGYEFN